jgi:hypothetical protein
MTCAPDTSIPPTEKPAPALVAAALTSSVFASSNSTSLGFAGSYRTHIAAPTCGIATLETVTFLVTSNACSPSG